MIQADPNALLTLTMIPGLGPILISRLLATFRTPQAILQQPPERLATVRGLSIAKARLILDHRRAAETAARTEAAKAADLGISLSCIDTDAYPPLLREIQDPPPILYIRGSINPTTTDRFTLGIVGSRSCSHYGMEQTERFAASLASAGISIISGGARGIDTAAHRAAMRVQGRTTAVLGCGLLHHYPKENAPLFDDIARNHGAIISELPLDTPPAAENFPARNRIISGLSLGILVVEAGHKSGSLITARLAAEEHNREVFALPGRVDSTTSEGTLDLIKAGGATMVTAPADILASLASPARHLHEGTHEARYALPELFDEPPTRDTRPDALPSPSATPRTPQPVPSPQFATLTPSQRVLLAALTEPRSLDDLLRDTGADVGALRADLTLLEIRRIVTREGSRFVAKRS